MLQRFTDLFILRIEQGITNDLKIKFVLDEPNLNI